jgi:hypothetical protein
MKLGIASILCSICLLVGCATTDKAKSAGDYYKRPELFSPFFEVAKDNLRNNRRTDRIVIEGPDWVKATAGSTYTFVVRGTKDRPITVMVDPAHLLPAASGSSSSSTASGNVAGIVNSGNCGAKMNTDEVCFTLAGETLLGLEQVTVSARYTDTKGRIPSEASLLGEQVDHTIGVLQPVEPGGEIESVEEAAQQDFEVELIPMAMADAEEEFGPAFASTFIACNVNFINNTPKPLMVYGASLRAELSMAMARNDVPEYFGEDALLNPMKLLTTEVPMSSNNGDGYVIAEHINWTADVRPLAFSDVLGIFEHQRHGDRRQRVIDYLRFLGAVAAPLDVFISAVDYPSGVALFTGVFTPELEKLILWDVLMHVQNLHERSLREIEEVAGYGQLNKIVFFPRRAIYGLNSMMPLYVDTISMDSGNVRGVFVEKLGPELQAGLKEHSQRVLAEAQAAGLGLAASPEVKAALDSLNKARADASAKRAAEAAAKAAKQSEEHARQEEFTKNFIHAFIEDFGVGGSIPEIMKLIEAQLNSAEGNAPE